jgi:hypothetical protein
MKKLKIRKGTSKYRNAEDAFTGVLVTSFKDALEDIIMWGD